MIRLYLMPDHLSAINFREELKKEGFVCLSGTNEHIIVLRGNKETIQILNVELKIKSSKIKEFPCDEICAGSLVEGLHDLIKNELQSKDYKKLKMNKR